MNNPTLPRAFRIAAVAVLIALPCTANAESKEMIQLQAQVQQLQEAVARLQQSNDERMGVLKDLVQQTADSVNKMSIAVNGVELRMQNQQDALTTKSDQVSGQVQSLNDSLDELKVRLARMEKTLNDVQGQQQSSNALLANLSQNAGVPACAPAADGAPAPALPAKPVASPKPAPVAGPSVTDLYHAAYGDYMAAKYPLAASEFDQITQTYPDDPLAGNAYFYEGEIEIRTGKPSAAIKSYDHVLEHYPDNVKTPAAHLHKAEALLSIKQNDAAVRELHSLIQRFPTSPEAAQAHTKLTALGVSAAPKR